MGKAESAVLSALMPQPVIAGMRRVPFYHRAAAAQTVIEEDCWVVEEQALFIDIT